MIDLTKGAKVNLSKESGTELKKLYAGLGWDANTSSGAEFDADVLVIFTDCDDKKTSDTDVIFYNNLKNDFAEHSGDNLTGEGDGDDEFINIDLSKIPEGISKGHVYVTIHEAKERGQNFGMLNNAMIHMQNGETKEELAKFELDFDASSADAIRFGTVIRRNNEWYFSADNVEVEGGLVKIMKSHGFNV